MSEQRASRYGRVAVGAVFLLVGGPLVAGGEVNQQQAAGQAGEQEVGGVAMLFEKQCYSCHNIGGGDKTGPDLTGVTERRSREWLHEFIVSPGDMKRKGDRDAVELFRKYSPEVMRDQMLSRDQVHQILDMIEELSEKNQMFVPQSGRLSREPVAGDIPAGRRLFKGQRKLGKGGPACIFCHSSAGIGYLGGGSLGPDLTNANLKFKDVELASILKMPGFPTMSKVYADHELSDEEVVQIFAFLRSLRRRVPDAAGPAFRYLVWSGAGVLVVLSAMSVIWRGRVRGVRRQLIRGSR